MNNLDKQYIDLLKDVLENGTQKTDRTGTGTISVFGRQIRHKMGEGFPLLTSKKMYFKGIVTELLWFLKGDTNIRYLVENDCHIWDGDAYKRYSKIAEMSSQVESLSREEFINKIKIDVEFAKKWGNLGPIYGKQWRDWTNYKLEYGNVVGNNSIDQIANLINDLKTNPDSRRLMVNAWNVAEIDSMVLPPCHYGFQIYTRELKLEEKVNWLNKNYPLYDLGELPVDKLLDDNYLKEVTDEYNIPTRAISLMWSQRSADFFLGVPFNIASYGLLLEILGKTLNMVPDEIIGNFGDSHIYLNHIEQSKLQISRISYNLPEISFSKSFYDIINQKITFSDKIELFDNEMFKLENYKYHPSIKAELSN